MSMQVLAINCGSASLKFALWNAGSPGAETSRFEGKVAWTDDGAVLRFVDPAGTVHERRETVSDHLQAVERVFQLLESLGELPRLQAVGHRVVHGGPKFHQAAVIDDDVVRELTAVQDLAPLHNPGALGAIRRARQLLPRPLPMVAVFDTAFHRQMPPKAERYPLTRALTERLGLRRYGFHGIAHS